MYPFDLHRAYCLALAAEVVYEEAAIIEQTVLQHWQFRQFQFYEVDDTQCFVAANEDAVIVSFRGTETDRISDWITDLDFDLVDGPFGGKIHEGFLEALSNVWELVYRQVGQLVENDQRILWVTGHSLGAALATLAVARWREQGHPVGGLYAFGQPRTGDRTFSRNFDFDFKPYTFRLVNHRDLVTRTPPRSLGYRHTGTFKYFNENGELLDHIGWWRLFLKGWSGPIENLLSWCGEGIRDHSMTQYRELLEAEIGKQHAPDTSDPVSIAVGHTGVDRVAESHQAESRDAA